MKDGPLDMRMDTSSGESVAEFLSHVDEVALADILWRYGEEKFSRKIARAIVAAEKLQPISRTTELADIIAKAMPFKDPHKHPATRSFQALRIYINQELQEVESALQASISVLKPGGKLAVISFHSLEDRIVKQFMQAQVKGAEVPRGLPLRDSEIPNTATMRWHVKMQGATETEINANIRARSAILRVVEKR
jgi:16S rRNA (cytosine1402-N4)-methyltransferase